jgi:polysaccharide biosynthesis transport protein
MMSDNPLPSASASRNSIDEPPQAPPQAFSQGGCESRRTCRCCKALGCLFCIALVLAICIFIGWRLLSPRYTATAYLRVAYQEKPVVFAADQPMPETEYEIFKNTQKQYVLSRFVLFAALRNPAENPIAHLPIIKNQSDPVDWLMRNLRVSFPDNSEFMKIELTTYDPKDAADIVTAVMDAYLSEVIDDEKNNRRQRVSELDRLYTDKDQEVRNKRNDLKQLAEQLGTAETENLNLKQKLTLEELATYRQELARSEFEVERLRSELASSQAELKTVQSADISDIECEMFAQNDPVLKNLMQENTYRMMDAQSVSGAPKQEDKSTNNSEKSKNQLEQLQKDYKNRLEKIREEIRHQRQGDVEKKIVRLEAAIEMARQQQKSNENDVQRLRKLAEQFGSSWVDVEMLRSDIAVKEKSLDTIAKERDKLKVELRADPRVKPMQKKADVPTAKSPLFWIF